VNNIPPLDLTRQYEQISQDISETVAAVLHSGRYIGGDLVNEFEDNFAQYIKTSECVSCNSGTDALYLVLRALEIGQGDEVITTPFSFIATAEIISLTGATPVFVDLAPGTFNLDVAQIEQAVTPKTKAIIPVHLFGHAVNMTRVMEIARAYNLYVIEDCAQATGAEWAGRKVGSIGHAGCFSFFPTKNLGACGDGGAVTTNDGVIADSVRMLKAHGSRQRYIHEAIGINSRLDSLQAAILSIKLRHLDTWNQQRREVARRYQRLLDGFKHIELPQTLANSQAVWNQYTVKITGGNLEKSALAPDSYRNEIKRILQEKGISSMVYYPLPLHLQPIYKCLGYEIGQLPYAETVAHQVLSLPMFPELTAEEQEQVAYALKEVLETVEG
jgi:dTDP-4-amino-4,6-dideoxygalactose transaminase